MENQGSQKDNNKKANACTVKVSSRQRNRQNKNCKTLDSKRSLDPDNYRDYLQEPTVIIASNKKLPEQSKDD